MNTNWAVLSEIPENYQFTRTAVINFRWQSIYDNKADIKNERIVL